MLASYPRSGNTWVRSLLFELLTGATPTFGHIDDRRSPVGHVAAHDSVPAALANGGRLLKTHEAYRPVYRRGVYLLRDPRDVAVSEYRFQRWRGLFDGPLDAFVCRFVAGRTGGWGRWDAHVRSWTAAASRANLLVMRYEDLRRAPVDGLAEIAAFLGLGSDRDALATVVENNSLRRMRDREDHETSGSFQKANKGFRFVNEGKVAGWREDQALHLTLRPVVASFGETMSRFGYLSTNAGPSAR